LKIAPHNVLMSTPKTRNYGLARALRARLIGTFLAAIGVVVVVFSVVAAAADVPHGVTAGLVVLGVLGALATGLLLGPAWYVVRLDEIGYRVRFVRGAGRTQARWTDVLDLTTAVVSGTPCVVLRLRDGGSTTVPVSLIEGDREEFVDELQRRLDAGHGYRRL
jgi:hypothetical protein